MPRTHTRAIELPAAPDEVFRLLHTPSAIRSWWHAARAIVHGAPGGWYVVAWGADEDDPDYVTLARIEVFDPPRRLRLTDYRYHAKSGPLPFEAAFVTEFRVSPAGRGGALLEVEQAGFPDDPAADAFFAGCEKGWHDTFESIRAYIAERGTR